MIKHSKLYPTLALPLLLLACGKVDTAAKNDPSGIQSADCLNIHGDWNQGLNTIRIEQKDCSSVTIADGATSIPQIYSINEMYESGRWFSAVFSPSRVSLITKRAYCTLTLDGDKKGEETGGIVIETVNYEKFSDEVLRMERFVVYHQNHPIRAVFPDKSNADTYFCVRKEPQTVGDSSPTVENTETSQEVLK